MIIIFVGDIVGRPGRRAASLLVPKLKKKFRADLVIANGENLAGGKGMTKETYDEMVEAGVDCFTSGNHIASKEEFLPYLEQNKVCVIRPANMNGVPGKGERVIKTKKGDVLLVNLIGRAFSKESHGSPFSAADLILSNHKEKVVLVDFHADATGEKAVLGYYLDGRVSALLGTNTHVPTADAQILPKGSAFITDVGMTGPIESTLGADLEGFLKAELGEGKARYKVAAGPVMFRSVLLDIDEKTGHARGIELLQYRVDVDDSIEPSV
jgi:metallophosphoesterase (TIGR00282 family)